MSQTPCDADLPTRFGMGEDRDEQPGRIGEAQAVDFPSAAAFQPRQVKVVPQFSMAELKGWGPGIPVDRHENSPCKISMISERI